MVCMNFTPRVLHFSAFIIIMQSFHPYFSYIQNTLLSGYIEGSLCLYPLAKYSSILAGIIWSAVECSLSAHGTSKTIGANGSIEATLSKTT